MKISVSDFFTNVWNLKVMERYWQITEVLFPVTLTDVINETEQPQILGPGNGKI